MQLLIKTIENLKNNNIEFTEFKNGIIINGDCSKCLDYIDNFDHVIQDLPYGYLKHRIETNIDYKTLFTKMRSKINDKGSVITFGRGDLFYEWNLFLRGLGFEHKEDCTLYKKNPPNVLNNFLRYGEYFSIRGLKGFVINKVKIPISDEANIDDIQIAKNHRRAFNGGKHKEFVKQFINDGTVFYDRERKCREIVTTGNAKTKNNCREVRALKSLMEGYLLGNVLHSSRELLPNGWSHPTIKPSKSMGYLIKAIINNENSIILDPTLGSGSLAIALINVNAETQSNHKFIGIELDKEYYDLSCERIRQREEEYLF